MSATALARLVEDAVGRGALVNEGEAVVIASNLAMADAAALAEGCRVAGLPTRMMDGAGNEWAVGDLEEAFAPYRLTITKPVQPEGTLAVLTASGFRQLLRGNPAADRWSVAALAAPIRTWSTLFHPWGLDEAGAPAVPTINPRRLVRESGAERVVPTSVGRWLLRGDAPVDLQDAGGKIWADEATRRLLASLPNEVDPETRELMFRGPPRLALSMPADQIGPDQAGIFCDLQKAASWVFANERETELRHTLLATEIARSGGSGEALAQFTLTLGPSLDGARIAYEMSMAGISADTLKALADLRKAVTEETAKVTESTRQTIAAITGAIAVGLGLVAARLTTQTDPWLITSVMVVAAVYVLLVIGSGAQFVLLQRGVRSDWQTRLYRFLPPADYSRLVSKPAGRAEFAFFTAAGGGVIAILLLAWAVITAKPAPRPARAVQPAAQAVKDVEVYQHAVQKRKVGETLPNTGATSGEGVESKPVGKPRTRPEGR